MITSDTHASPVTVAPAEMEVAFNVVVSTSLNVPMLPTRVEFSSKLMYAEPVEIVSTSRSVMYVRSNVATPAEIDDTPVICLKIAVPAYTAGVLMDPPAIRLVMVAVVNAAVDADRTSM